MGPSTASKLADQVAVAVTPLTRCRQRPLLDVAYANRAERLTRCALLCYAWFSNGGSPTSPRAFTVLREGPIHTSVDAVRFALEDTAS